MAALQSFWPTLLDVARSMDPDGKIATSVEILNQYNEILDDIPWTEGNLPTGHQITLRKSIPVPTWRLLNQGITPQKSVNGQITETCGILEEFAEIDVDVAKLNGNTAEWRLNQDRGILEGFNQAFAKALIYGDTTVNPEQIVGLAPRYYTVNTTNSTAAVNVIDALGTGNVNTSVWLVGWAPMIAEGIYPKGSQAGFLRQDLGEETAYDASNNRLRVYRTRYQWKTGLAISDYRYVVRIANIDTTNLQTAGDTSDTSTNLLKYMSIALDKLFNINMVRPVFYMNNLVRSYLRVKMLNAKNMFLTLKDYESPTGIQRPTLTFMDYPCRRVDQILNTEARVV